MRFTRKQRLGSQAEFRFVFSRPRRSRDPYFKVLTRENNREFCRLGMAVSKKVCRKAVQRNRLKRLIRESFRSHFAMATKEVDAKEGIAASSGFDIVVLPTAQAATICNRTLVNSLKEHWLTAQNRNTESAQTNNRNKLDG